MNDKIFELNPKDFPKNKPIIIFLIIFGSIFLLGSCLGIRKLIIDFSYVHFFVLILTSLVGVASFLILLFINAKEIIEINSDGLIFKNFGPIKINKVVPINSFLGLHFSKGSIGYELQALYSLKDKIVNIPIAPFVSNKDKIQIFNNLSLFLKNNDIDFKVTNEII